MAKELEFENSAEGTRKSRTSGVLWGLAKCGKTTFLTSLPGKKLWIMVDPDGDLSISDHPDNTILRLYQYTDGEIIRLLGDKVPTMLRKGEYDSVILDSLSTLGQAALNEAIRLGVGASKKDGFVPTLDAPGLAAYGSRTSQTVDIVNKLLRATGAVGSHMWFTSHEDEPKTDNKGAFMYITMTLSGKAISGVGLNVSEIWYMSQNDGKWRIAISPCRGKKPMGSRMFDITKAQEFDLKFDKNLGSEQPHSIATWFRQWEENGRKDLPIPK